MTLTKVLAQVASICPRELPYAFFSLLRRKSTVSVQLEYGGFLHKRSSKVKTYASRTLGWVWACAGAHVLVLGLVALPAAAELAVPAQGKATSEFARLPFAARATVSRVLGRDQQAFRVRASLS